MPTDTATGTDLAILHDLNRDYIKAQFKNRRLSGQRA